MRWHRGHSTRATPPEGVRPTVGLDDGSTGSSSGLAVGLDLAAVFDEEVTLDAVTREAPAATKDRREETRGEESRDEEARH